ncbi:unnamed protein product, partial [Rotaria sp. Silwood1]
IQDIINELVESILKIESANDQVSSNKMVATFIGLYALFLCTNFCFLNAGITSAADVNFIHDNMKRLLSPFQKLCV